MKNKLKFYALLLCTLIVFGCSNDDGNSSSNNTTAINLVTGVNAKSDVNSIFRLGNPNVRMPIGLSSVAIIAYPNPVISALSIEISQTNEVMTDVWLVNANAQQIYQDIDFDEILNENTYTVNEISQASVQAFNDLSNTNITLNLDGFNTGYYRVFIKTNQSLYWDNIYIDNNGTDITEFFESWE